MMKNHESQNKIDKYSILIILYSIILSYAP